MIRAMPLRHEHDYVYEFVIAVNCANDTHEATQSDWYIRVIMFAESVYSSYTKYS